MSLLRLVWFVFVLGELHVAEIRRETGKQKVRKCGKKMGKSCPEGGKMKAERPENHTKMASGCLLGGSWGGPKRLSFKSPCRILSNFGPPRGGSGRPLGSPWDHFGCSWLGFWRSGGHFLRFGREIYTRTAAKPKEMAPWSAKTPYFTEFFEGSHSWRW